MGYYSNNYRRRRVRRDRFGRETLLVPIKEKEDKYPCGYLKLGSSLYKVTIATGQKEDKNGVPIVNWVTLTKMKRN